MAATRRKLSPLDPVPRLPADLQSIAIARDSRKWALGAIAELVDSALSRAKNEVTVEVDVSKDDSAETIKSISVQDDGVGLSEQSLRTLCSVGLPSLSQNSHAEYVPRGCGGAMMRLCRDVLVLSKSHVVGEGEKCCSFVAFMSMSLSAPDPTNPSFSHLLLPIVKVDECGNISEGGEAGRWLIDQKIEVWRAAAQEYAAGVVTEYLNDQAAHRVEFENGVTEQLLLGAERWRAAGEAFVTPQLASWRLMKHKLPDWSYVTEELAKLPSTGTRILCMVPGDVAELALHTATRDLHLRHAGQTKWTESTDLKLYSSLTSYLELLYASRTAEIMLCGRRIRKRNLVTWLTDPVTFTFDLQLCTRSFVPGMLPASSGANNQGLVPSSEEAATVACPVTLIIGLSKHLLQNAPADEASVRREDGSNSDGGLSGFFVYNNKRLVTQFHKVPPQARGTGEGVVGIVDISGVREAPNRQALDLSAAEWQRLDQSLERHLFTYMEQILARRPGLSSVLKHTVPTGVTTTREPSTPVAQTPSVSSDLLSGSLPVSSAGPNTAAAQPSKRPSPVAATGVTPADSRPAQTSAQPYIQRLSQTSTLQRAHASSAEMAPIPSPRDAVARRRDQPPLPTAIAVHVGQVSNGNGVANKVMARAQPAATRPPENRQIGSGAANSRPLDHRSGSKRTRDSYDEGKGAKALLAEGAAIVRADGDMLPWTRESGPGLFHPNSAAAAAAAARRREETESMVGAGHFRGRRVWVVDLVHRSARVGSVTDALRRGVWHVRLDDGPLVECRLDNLVFSSLTGELSVPEGPAAASVLAIAQSAQTQSDVCTLLRSLGLLGDSDDYAAIDEGTGRDPIHLYEPQVASIINFLTHPCESSLHSDAATGSLRNGARSAEISHAGDPSNSASNAATSREKLKTNAPNSLLGENAMIDSLTVATTSVGAEAAASRYYHGLEDL